jgi:hypothetical protein
VNGYTIPGDTQRPYALIGPLSLEQAGLLAAGALAAWRLLRADLAPAAAAALLLPLGAVTLGLAFGRWPLATSGEPLRAWLARGLRYLRRPRRLTLRSGVERLCPAVEVRAAAVRLRGGAVRVLEVAAAPFELADPGEREAVLAGYRAFLHALPGPVEIVSVCERLRLDDRVRRLRAAAAGRSDAIGAQMAAYADFVERLLGSRHIVTRRHYLVLARPCGEGAAAFAEALRRLGADEAALVTALQRMGLASRTLDDDGLVRLLGGACSGRAASLPAPAPEFLTYAVTGRG